MLSVAILAGGLATRLRPVSDRVPKSLVEVAGRPFVRWQLDLLREQGVEEVVLCLGHLGEQVEAEVGDGAAHGLRVRYSRDGARPLGTGGALRQALPLLGDPFFVLYGDSYLPVDFGAVWRSFREAGRPALMTVLHNLGRWDRSNALYRDGRVVEYDRQTPRPELEHVDFGLGVLSARVLADRPAGTAFDLAEVYRTLSLAGELAGHEVHQRFYEIGSHRGLEETAAFLRERSTS